MNYILTVCMCMYVPIHVSAYVSIYTFISISVCIFNMYMCKLYINAWMYIIFVCIHFVYIYQCIFAYVYLCKFIVYMHYVCMY